MKRYLADFGLLLVGILWGLGFVFVKIGLNEGIDPFYLSSIRFLLGFMALYLIFRKKVSRIVKRDINAGIVIGFFQFMGYLTQTYGLTMTTASKNAFFTAINVVIVPYIFWILHKKKPDIFSFVASIVCLAGVGVISFDANMNLTDINRGDILTIISAFFFAGQIATTGYFSRKIEPMKLIFIQMLVAGILFLITQFVTTGVRAFTPLSGMTLVSVIYLVLFSTAIPTLLQTFCQKATTSTRASILMSTESLFAPLFAFLLLHEVLTLKVIFGAGLILFAVLISETKLGLAKMED